jgi:hypothetical protein
MRIAEVWQKESTRQGLRKFTGPPVGDWDNRSLKTRSETVRLPMGIFLRPDAAHRQVRWQLMHATYGFLWKVGRLAPFWVLRPPEFGAVERPRAAFGRERSSIEERSSPMMKLLALCGVFADVTREASMFAMVQEQRLQQLADECIHLSERTEDERTASELLRLSNQVLQLATPTLPSWDDRIPQTHWLPAPTGITTIMRRAVLTVRSCFEG